MASNPEGALAAAVGEAAAGDVGVTVALADGVGVDEFVGTAAGVALLHATVTIRMIASASAIALCRVKPLDSLDALKSALHPNKYLACDRVDHRH